MDDFSFILLFSTSPLVVKNFNVDWPELARENNCKATILSDTARMLQDLLALVDSLRRENEALTAESLHVSLNIASH